MASVRISNLPSIQATGLTYNDVFATSDSGSSVTSKITLGNLLKNGSLISDDSTGKENFFGAAGIDANSPTVGAEFRGNTFGAAIIAGNGYINDSNSSFMAATLEAGGGNSVYINNGSQHTILSSFRCRIDGGERSSIIANEDGFINNAYNGAIVGNVGGTINQGPSLLAGSQGCEIQSNRAVIIASEGMILNSNMSASIASYGGTINGNLYQVSLGTYVPTFTNPGGYENMIQIGARESEVAHQRASMISTSGRTSQFSGTAHFDNTYVWGHETHPNKITTTISNIQYFDADLGMVQYCDVLAGNLNFEFQNVRNGEMYRFVIDNQTGAAVSLNSVAVPAGFTYVDDTTGGSLGTGIHTYYITVIKDLVIVGHYK
jgi:hypothetical protein